MGQEDRSILDRPLRELERLCHYVCENPQCPESQKFQGVSDNALVKCNFRYCLKDQDIGREATADRFKDWGAAVREAVQKHHARFPQTWNECSPRFVFHVNKALKEHRPRQKPLKIRVSCADTECEEVLGSLSLVHTPEKLYNDLRLFLVNDSSLPFEYIKGGENRSLPDDARAVCELVHRPAVDEFVEKLLPENLQYIEKSLDASLQGILRVRLEKKRSDAQEAYLDPNKT